MHMYLKNPTKSHHNQGHSSWKFLLKKKTNKKSESEQFIGYGEEDN